MKYKYVICAALGLTFIVGYNVWLIQRDKQLFDAHVNKPVTYNPPSNYIY